MRQLHVSCVKQMQWAHQWVHPRSTSNQHSKRKDTPHPNIGVLLGDIEECHLPETEVVDNGLDLSALTMLGNVSTAAAEYHWLHNEPEQQRNKQPKHDTAAGAVEADHGCEAEAAPDWPAQCARHDCPCSSSCNGQQGEHCSTACRNGKACSANIHTEPFMSGVMGQHKWLELENDIKPVPRELPYKVCCCWLGCRVKLNAQEIDAGYNLCAGCNERHAAGILDMCGCECKQCTTTALQYIEVGSVSAPFASRKGRKKQVRQHSQNQTQSTLTTQAAAAGEHNWETHVTDPVTGITDVLEEDDVVAQVTRAIARERVAAAEAKMSQEENEVRSGEATWTGSLAGVTPEAMASRREAANVTRVSPKPKQQQHKQQPEAKKAKKSKEKKKAERANWSKSAEQKTRVDTREATAHRTGNVHVNVTVPEAPRNLGGARRPACHDYRQGRNNASGKGKGGGKGKRSGGKGDAGNFWEKYLPRTDSRVLPQRLDYFDQCSA